MVSASIIEQCPCAPSSPASKPLWGTYFNFRQLAPQSVARVRGAVFTAGDRTGRHGILSIHLRPEAVCGLWATLLTHTPAGLHSEPVLSESVSKRTDRRRP